VSTLHWRFSLDPKHVPVQSASGSMPRLLWVAQSYHPAAIVATTSQPTAVRWPGVLRVVLQTWHRWLTGVAALLGYWENVQLENWVSCILCSGADWGVWKLPLKTCALTDAPYLLAEQRPTAYWTDWLTSRYKKLWAGLNVKHNNRFDTSHHIVTIVSTDTQQMWLIQCKYAHVHMLAWHCTFRRNDANVKIKGF